MSVPAADLARCPVFAMLAPQDLAGFAAVSRARSVRKGGLVFRDGDPCEGMFIVTSGSVRIYKVAADGRERTLHLAKSPDAFAEAALFMDTGYPAFAEALSDTRLILVPRAPFLRLLVERPASTLGMFRSLSQWTHRLLDELEAETFLNARARLATWLLRELRRQPATAPGRVRLQQPRKAIALQLGMAPETFSRIQADFEARGIIRAATRHVDVLDRDALHNVVLE
jgi:CRP/FNR family transcriptional regulator